LNISEFFGFRKKLSIEEERLKTANEFINVKDVCGSVLYGRDGLIYGYLKIQPFSLDTLSDAEKNKKNHLFAAEFSAEKKPFKFFSSSRPVDISGLMADLEERISDPNIDPVRKNLLKYEIAELNAVALGAEITERQCYMMMWERTGKDGERELLKRLQDNKTRFAVCEINTEICGQSAVVRMLNLFSNPNYAHVESDDIKPTIPFAN
jgi:hypothetical protein